VYSGSDSNTHDQSITQMLKILCTCKCGQLDGRTRAVFPSCMTIFPEVQWWQSWSYIQTLCKIT